MTTLNDLLQDPSKIERVQAALNVLLEAPYFYKTDDEDLFLFIRRYNREFDAFFETHFGWSFVCDAKCARVYKPKWHNDRITPLNRDLFNFTRRDDCIAFMLLLEFFESKLEEESILVNDPENLRFRFGELLAFERARFQETFPEQESDYDDESVRKILRNIMPVLERYRFLLKIKPPDDEAAPVEEDVIYECLPALWHYNATAVARPPESGATDETGGDEP